MSISGNIFNIQKFCIHDGDGIRTTVFVKGCPLRCKWCHNPESQAVYRQLIVHTHLCTGCARCISVCPEGARKVDGDILTIVRNKCTVCGKCADVCFNGVNECCGYNITAEEAFAVVMRDKIFYETSGGGMTVSGGEPSMQPEFTLELLRLAKENGINSAIETCGFGKREFFVSSHKLGCTFLYDLKCLIPSRHKDFTGVSVELIVENLETLFSLGADVILRLPLIPSLNDTCADIDAASDFLKLHNGKYRYAEIMAYHNLGISKECGLGKTPLLDIPNAEKTDKEHWVSEFAKRGVTVKVN